MFELAVVHGQLFILDLRCCSDEASSDGYWNNYPNEILMGGGPHMLRSAFFFLK